MTDEPLSPSQIAEAERTRLRAEATATLGEKKTSYDRANSPLAPAAQRMADFIGDQTKMARLAAGSPEAQREWAAVREGRDHVGEALAGAPVTYQDRMLADAADNLRGRGLSEDSVRIAIEGLPPDTKAEDALAVKRAAVERRREILSDSELTRKWLAGDFELGRIMTAAAVALSADITEKK